MPENNNEYDQNDLDILEQEMLIDRYMHECGQFVAQCANQVPTHRTLSNTVPQYDVHRHYTIRLYLGLEDRATFENTTCALGDNNGRFSMYRYRRWAESVGLAFQDGNHIYVLEYAEFKRAGVDGIGSWNELELQFIEQSHRTR